MYQLQSDDSCRFVLNAAVCGVVRHGLLTDEDYIGGI